jgi:hypothetical protein
MKRTWLLVGSFALACGGRPDAWDEPFEPGAVVGLQTSVAVVDPELDRVIMLESPSHLGLRSTVLPVGRDIVAAVPSPKNDRLLVLSKGVQPRLNKGDEPPSLTVIDTIPRPKLAQTYALDDPFGGLSLDPEGRWAIVYAGEGIVQNPNEIILVDLENPASDVVVKSIRSFGGRPVGFTFTSELAIAGTEPRRILVVHTEQDFTLIDLADLDAGEITVHTPTNAQGLPSTPKQIVFHDAVDGSDPQIAVSFTNNPDVFLISIVPNDGENAFYPEVNSIEVGGTPSAIEFVETDDGLRLAALVPTAQQAALVDPATSAVDLVPMPAAFTGIARVTDSFEAPSNGDVALLWSSNVGRVGIWHLDTAIDTPYASIETFNIAVGVSRVLDVPGPEQGACLEASECFAEYKIVAGTGPQDFYLLDLNAKEASLMVNNGANLSLSLSPDGERLWAFAQDGTSFAQVAFANLHPSTLTVEAPIRGVFDVGRPNRTSENGDTARSAIVVHSGEGLGVTVFDALEPDETVTRFYRGLAYEGLSK